MKICLSLVHLSAQDYIRTTLFVIGIPARAKPVTPEQNDALPNQINLPSKQPTLRWVFQLMEGVNLVEIVINGICTRLIDGLCDLKKKIIELFGEKVKNIYMQSASLGAHKLNISYCQLLNVG